jgi:hypothetical protein
MKNTKTTKNSTSNFIISELDDRFQQQRSGYDKVIFLRTKERERER